MLGLTAKQTHDVEFFHDTASLCLILYHAKRTVLFCRIWCNQLKQWLLLFSYPRNDFHRHVCLLHVCGNHFLGCLGTVVPKLCKSVKTTKINSTKWNCWLNLPEVQPVTILKISLPWHLPSFKHLTGGEKPGISPPRISLSLFVRGLVQTICGTITSLWH